MTRAETTIDHLQYWVKNVAKLTIAFSTGFNCSEYSSNGHSKTIIVFPLCSFPPPLPPCSSLRKVKVPKQPSMHKNSSPLVGRYCTHSTPSSSPKSLHALSRQTDDSMVTLLLTELDVRMARSPAVLPILVGKANIGNSNNNNNNDNGAVCLALTKDAASARNEFLNTFFLFPRLSV